jgi:hypothetical protein
MASSRSRPVRFAVAAGPPNRANSNRRRHAAAAAAFPDRLRANAADDAAWVEFLLAARAAQGAVGDLPLFPVKWRNPANPLP